MTLTEETLEEGIMPSYVLQEDEALVIQAIDRFTDTSGGGEYGPDQRKSALARGSRWDYTHPYHFSWEFLPKVKGGQ